MNDDIELVVEEKEEKKDRKLQSKLTRINEEESQTSGAGTSSISGDKRNRFEEIKANLRQPKQMISSIRMASASQGSVDPLASMDSTNKAKKAGK